MQDGIWHNSESLHLQTLHDLVSSLAKESEISALVAVSGQGTEQWSYTKLSGLVAELANGLTDRGIGPGVHVALCAAHSPTWIVAALAILASGAILVPVDPQSDAASLAHIVKDCNATLWFTSSHTDRRLRERTDDPISSFLLDSAPDAANSWQSLRQHGGLRSPDLTPDDTAVMFYTSGTTGLPKGVSLSHRNLIFQLDTLRTYELIEAGERILLALPLHHVYPFTVGVLGSLALCGTLVIPRALTGPEIARALRDGKVATLIGVPRLLEVLLTGLLDRLRARNRTLSATLSALIALNVRLRKLFGIRLARSLIAKAMRRQGITLRMVVSGGAPLDAALAARLDALGWAVTTGYGLTETSPLLSILKPGDRRFTTVGKPIPGINLRIASTTIESEDEEFLRSPQDGDPRESPSIGEIQVCGPGVFSGYHNLSDKTAAAFTDDGWFRTEDLGYLDRQGYLHVIGRKSTLLVTAAGENVQPEMLEQEYMRAPVIREIGVFQRQGALCAVVVPDSKTLPQATRKDVEPAIARAVSEVGMRLPSHHRISRYVISQDALPRTRLGKIRRAELLRRFEKIESGQRSMEYRMPGPMPLEEMSDDDKALLDEPIARAVWDQLCERYGDRPLTPDSSLAMDLGVDSLEWLNVTLAIEQNCGASITEEATARIETLRDLLNEAVEAESSELSEASNLVFDDPQRFLTDTQSHWLQPLGRMETCWARGLYTLNRLAMRHLFRLEIIGREHLPRVGNFICTPNHMSVLDPFVIAAAIDFAQLRRTYWAGWTGMAFANRLFRFISRLAQVLPIEHNRAAFSSLAMSLIVLDEGKNLAWFPEGARSRDGQLRCFRTGIGLLLSRRPVQAVPMLIEGTFEAMPPGQRLPRLKPLTLVIGQPMTPEALENAGSGSSREERIANGLHDIVEQLRHSVRQ